MQRIALLAFTPRGSKPTMSKRLRSAVGKTPDPPARPNELDPGRARPAGVDDERSDPVLGSVADRRTIAIDQVARRRGRS